MLYNRIQDELANIEASGASRKRCAKALAQPIQTRPTPTESSQMCLAAKAPTGGTPRDEETNIDGETVQCLDCNANKAEDSIVCGTCGMWYQYFCKNLTHEEFCHHTDNPSATFECSICLSIRCEDTDLGLPKPALCSGDMREILADSGDCYGQGPDALL